MKKRQKLGQHFLKSKNVAKSIVSKAEISVNDTVLEIGTGKGILTPLLCEKAKKVISIESDKQLFEASKINFSNLQNLYLIYGDGFKTHVQFSVFVSNLPYSKSRKAVEWLAQKKFDHAIIMIQKEFAEKLLSTGKHRKAISIIANYAFECKTLFKIDKNNFFPPPKIDSVVVRLQKKKNLSPDLIKTVNMIFSYRRKTLQNIFKQFDKINDSKKRLDKLQGDEIIKIAKQIIKK